MRVAMILFGTVRHLEPVILMGLPRGDWAAPQKVRWAAEHFPGHADHHVPGSRQAPHARDGDILVDDTLKYRALWTGAGGTFVHHRDAETTLAQLWMLIPEGICRGRV
jgi:hypothetical protein